MVLGGLWHGASWNFVLWGVAHGLLLIVHRLFREACEHAPRLRAALETVPGTLWRVGCTFLTVALCWVFFRAPTFDLAMAFFRRLVVANPAGKNEPLLVIGFVLTALFVFLAHLPQAMPLWKRFVASLPSPGARRGLRLRAELRPVHGPAHRQGVHLFPVLIARRFFGRRCFG